MPSDLFDVKKDEELVLQSGSLPLLLHFFVHFYGLPKGVPEETLEVLQIPVFLPQCFVCDYHSYWPKILAPILPSSQALLKDPRGKLRDN